MDWAHLYTRFDGRISRKTYWLASMPLLIVALLIAGVGMAVSDGYTRRPDVIYRVILFGAETALWYPVAAFMVKRLHDRHRHGAYVFILLVPFWLLGIDQLFGWSELGKPTLLEDAIVLFGLVVWLLFLIELGFRRGTAGPSQYGPDPLEPLPPGVRSPA